jgi:mono/diheme cytochrome c family protein
MVGNEVSMIADLPEGGTGHLEYFSLRLILFAFVLSVPLMLESNLLLRIDHCRFSGSEEAEMKWKILGIIVFAAVAIQFIPYGKDYTNPSVVAEPGWDHPRTRELFFRACGDCHSNETRWPWYGRIAPVSWLVRHDVDEGREHFNVSVWGIQNRNKGDGAAKEVREGEMPPWFYAIPHPEARLSREERAELIKGLLGTFGEGG